MKGKRFLTKTIIVLFALILVVGCGKKNFTVTFDSANGTTNEQIVEKGKQVSKLVDPIKEGYEFIGWFLGENEFDFKTAINKNITLTAKWEKQDVPVVKPDEPNVEKPNEEVKKYTVTFNTNGGSSITKQTIETGLLVTKPTNPVKEGYTFSYWKYQEKEFNFKNSIKENITLIAVWTKNSTPKPEVVKYTVTFDSNGGNSIGKQTIETGKKALQPTNPVREGYKFIGWTLKNSNFDFNSSITGNITLTAKWEEVITYTYKIDYINEDRLSTDRLVKIYKNNKDITSSVSMLLGNDNSPLGKYSKNLGGIKIVYAEFLNYSNYKININGSIYDLKS